MRIGELAERSGWVLFAEVVVDRQGLWRYLPGYEMGTLCVWDIAVAALIGAAVVYGIRRTRSGTSL
jgi:hypothetical protein